MKLLQLVQLHEQSYETDGKYNNANKILLLSQNKEKARQVPNFRLRLLRELKISARF